MYVVLLSAEYPPQQGGIGHYTRQLALALQQQGCDVAVLSSREAEGGAGNAPPVHASIDRWGWRCLPAIRRFLRQDCPDVLHLQYQTGAYRMHPAIHFLPEALGRRPCSPRLVVTMHDLRLPYLFPKAGPLRRWLVAHLLRRADAVIVTNTADLARLQGQGKPQGDLLAPLCLPRPPQLIPLGSSLPPTPPHHDPLDWRARQGIAAERPLLGYFGLLHPSKGADLLIQTLAEMQSQDPAPHLLIVGGGTGSTDPGNVDFREELRAQIERLGLAGAVHWTGPVPDDQAAAYLCACDLVVLPYRDGASLRRSSLVAALSLGCAVLTTQPLSPAQVSLGPGQPTLQHGYNVHLVPPRDGTALRQALVELLQAPDQRRQLARQAVALGDLFRWETIARRTQLLYQDVRPTTPPSPPTAVDCSHYRTLVELCPDGMFTCDLEGRLLTVNRAICERTGYRAHELVGMNLAQIIPEEERTALQKRLDRLRQGESSLEHVEHEVLTKDGRRYFTEVIAVPLPKGDQAYGLMGITRDISKRKWAEERLQQYGQQVQALLGTLWGLWAEMDLDNLLQRIIEEAVTMVPRAQAGSLLLVEGESFVFRGAVGYDLAALQNIRMPAESIFTQPLRQGRVVRLKNLAQHNRRHLDPHTIAALDRSGRSSEIQSVLLSPILWKDTLLGYITVDNFEREDAFDAQAEDILAQLSLQAGVAIRYARLYWAAQQQRELAETLQDVGATLAGTLALDQVLDRIMEQLHRIVPYDAANVMLLEGEQVRIRRARGYEPFGLAAYILNWSFPVGQYSNLNTMLQEQCPVVISDTRSDPHWKTLEGFEWLRSYAGAPVRLRGQIVGFLNVDSSTPRFYQQEHGARLQALADQAAVAIANAQLYGQAQQRLDQLELLLETSAAITATVEVEPLLELILDSAIQAIPPAEKGSILLRDPECDELYVAALHGYEDARVWDFRFQTATGYSTRVATWGRPMLIPDASIYAEISHHGDIPEMRDILSAAVSPLEVRGKIMGVISLDNASRKGAFSEQDLRLLTTMAHHAAIAIDKAQLFEEQRQALEALRVAQQQLIRAQKMEAIGRLAGGVAHDFNNFLTGLMLNVEFAMQDVPTHMPLYENLQEIHNLGQRATRLTRQLLLMSRRQISEPCPINLNDVIQNALKMLRRVIGEHIQVLTELATDLPTIEADSVQMEQVLLNLALNARDAMPEGGVLTIRTDDLEIHPGTQPFYLDPPAGPCVVLTVQDSGIGMPAETLAHIFEPFYTTKEEGTGLGLAVVYGIVKQHRGGLSVQSRPRQGTTFKVYLPAIAAPASRPEAILPGASPIGGSETILLVEDESSVRGMLQTLLGEHGYQLLVCVDGRQALTIAMEHEQEIDLVLTDLVLPGLNGLDLIAYLRQGRPNLPAILMTGYGDRSVHLEGLTGQTLLLPKPFSTHDLLQRLREVLDGG
ncbi:MAG: GAF domain-containing protein [Chloroflexia bacterium]|nr:GAF domain-containing protein [Chloroflexia bacterium]